MEHIVIDSHKFEDVCQTDVSSWEAHWNYICGSISKGFGINKSLQNKISCSISAVSPRINMDSMFG